MSIFGSARTPPDSPYYQRTEEIARLRNSWSVVTQADFTIALRDQLQEIVKRHGAYSDGPVGIAALANRTVLGRKVSQRLNGYGPALG